MSNMGVHNNSQLTFTVFPKLPIELQLKIWKAAIPKPGTIPVNYRQATGNNLDFVTKIKPSGLLRACKFSREIILKTFTASIKSPKGNIIRFDGQNDVILLLAVNFRVWDKILHMAYDHSHQFSGIKHLAICFRPLALGYFDRFGSLVSQFDGLEQFYIVDPGYGVTCCEDLCQEAANVELRPVIRAQSLEGIEQSGKRLISLVLPFPATSNFLRTYYLGLTDTLVNLVSITETLESLERENEEYEEYKGQREEELQNYKNRYLPEWKVPEISWVSLLVESDTMDTGKGGQSQDWHQLVTPARFDAMISGEEMELFASELKVWYQSDH